MENQAQAVHRENQGEAALQAQQVHEVNQV